MSFYFLTEFLKYFFRVLHAASSSWLKICRVLYIQVSQKWRTNYLLPYRGCLNVHEKNMEKMFPTKKSIIFIIIINGNTM
jgi:hypothetical protein